MPALSPGKGIAEQVHRDGDIKEARLGYLFLTFIPITEHIFQHTGLGMTPIIFNGRIHLRIDSNKRALTVSFHPEDSRRFRKAYGPCR